ncbi:uncharacterized protein LOC125855976 [Solanum stenotomum]|uniref:uncharacterized protein LOC125855976 n=1 Tax=Solanum stenotomum TaxID=172797 RepID=UPI0020D05C34|nr:uncharacterized protein LOC125855976 [Solanum stenotomum]
MPSHSSDNFSAFPENSSLVLYDIAVSTILIEFSSFAYGQELPVRLGFLLRDGSAHQGTVTSMEPYVGSFILHSEEDKKGKLKLVLVVNVQGHSRLRPKLDEILPQAAGVVFVVDSVEFLPNCRHASEYLYEILTKASVVKKKVPVLLLCNKVIVAEASGLTGEISQLEKFSREIVKP